MGLRLLFALVVHMLLTACTAGALTATPEPPPTDAETTSWRGEYFDNAFLGGDPVLVRQDELINFHWGDNAPAKGLPADHFTVRWSTVTFFEEATYRFSVMADDGIRVTIDGEKVLVNTLENPLPFSLLHETVTNPRKPPPQVVVTANGSTVEIEPKYSMSRIALNSYPQHHEL